MLTYRCYFVVRLKTDLDKSAMQGILMILFHFDDLILLIIQNFGWQTFFFFFFLAAKIARLLHKATVRLHKSYVDIAYFVVRLKQSC